MKCNYPLCNSILSPIEILMNFRCPFCNEGQFCSKLCCQKYWKDLHYPMCKTKLEMNMIQKNSYSQMLEDVYQGTILNSSQLQEYLKHLKWNSSNLINPNNSEEEEMIGKGGSSEVVLKIDKLTLRKYALKKINKATLSKALNANEVEAKVRKEIMLHLSIKHPNIINLYTYFETSETISLVIEHAEGGNLYEIIKTNRRLNFDRAMFLFIQICNAIFFLHKNQIVHRDIKPENLLLSNNIIKLCDFGISTYLGVEKRSTFCGTYEFMAPEIFNPPIKYDEKVDVWALGILLYEMINGKSPFQASTPNDIMSKIMKGKIPQTIHMPLKLYNFISNMLNPDPVKRFSVQEILQHDFIQDFLKDYCLKSIMPLQLGKNLITDNTSQKIQEISSNNFNEINKNKEINKINNSSILNLSTPSQENKEEDFSSYNIGQEDEAGSEKRIAKLNKYNENSLKIHYKPKTKGSYQSFGLDKRKNISFDLYHNDDFSSKSNFNKNVSNVNSDALSSESKEEKKNYHFSQFYNNSNNHENKDDDNEESKEVTHKNENENKNKNENYQLQLSKQISESSDMMNLIPNEPSIQRFENISPSELLNNE